MRDSGCTGKTGLGRTAGLQRGDMQFWCLTVLLAFCLSGRCGSEPFSPQDASSALQNLTGRSSPWLRPVRTWQSPLAVHLDLAVQAVLDMDEKAERVQLHVLLSQRWRDEFLSWDPADYGGLTHFTLPASQVWTPDMVVREAVSEDHQQSTPYVSLSFSGSVRLVETLLLDLRCDLLMFLFPFDKQTCNLTLGSNLHSAQEMVLVLEQSTHSLLPTGTLHGEWELLSVQSHTFTQVQGHQSYSRITFQVELQRYSLFYVVNLMVPSTLVMIIDLAGFCIPVESAERIPFKVTLLFGYTVFLVLVTDLLPPFRDATPMLGVYLVVCLAFLSLSMGESVVLLALGQLDLPEVPSHLHAIVSMWCPDVLQELQRPAGWPERNAARGLRHAYGLGQRGAEPGCGPGCAIEALAQELKEVSGELRSLTYRLQSRQRGLRLMEAMDRVCFRVYLSLFATFLVILSLLWGLYR